MEKSCFNRATLPWFLNSMFIASYISSSVVVILLYSKKRNLPFRKERRKKISRRRRCVRCFFPVGSLREDLGNWVWCSVDDWIQTTILLVNHLARWRILGDGNLHYRNVTNLVDDSACCLSDRVFAVAQFSSHCWRHLVTFLKFISLARLRPPVSLIWFATVLLSLLSISRFVCNKIPENFSPRCS